MPGFGHGPGSQSRDFLIAGVGQAVEQFPQIGVGFQAVAFGRLDYREDDRAGLARFFGTDEQPILRTKLGRADGVFHKVVVDLDHPVVKEHFQIRPVVRKRHVSHRRNWLGPCRKRGRLPGYDNYERR